MAVISDDHYHTSILLRSHIGLNINTNRKGRKNLLAFSPDIMPLFETDIKDVEIFKQSYEHFSALPLISGKKNNIYVRGCVPDRGKSADTDVTLSTTRNELILWPQVINNAKKLGTIRLFRGKVKRGEVVASTKRIVYIPPPMFIAGHDTLFTKTEKHSPEPQAAHFPIVKNWREFLNCVGTDDSFSSYNVVVVDPIFEVYTLSTRLRFFDDSDKPIKLHVDVECLGIPEGYEFSLESDDPNFNIARTALVNHQSIGCSFKVWDRYDVLVKVKIYKVEKTLMDVIPENASVSIITHIIERPDPQKRGDSDISYIIGGEHIVFTPNLRYFDMSSGAANQPSTWANIDDGNNFPGKNIRTSPDIQVAGKSFFSDLETQYSSATTLTHYSADNQPSKWWFRANLGDLNNFPRPPGTNFWISPDIQVAGESPVSDSEAQYGGANYDVDSSKTNIASNKANYIYLRARCSGAVDIQARLYVLPSQILLQPRHYSQYLVTELDQERNRITAIRNVKSDRAKDLVFKSPFNAFNPPQPQAGHHYCIVAETRVNDPNEYWPFEDPPTDVDFFKFLGNNPHICQRNIGWSNSGSDIIAWQTSLYLAGPIINATSKYQLYLDMENVPIGGVVSLTVTGTVDFNIAETTVSQAHHFTIAGKPQIGIQLPYQETVTIQWRSNTPLGNKARFNVSLRKLQYQTPANFHSSRLHASHSQPIPAVNTILDTVHRHEAEICVGPAYPNLGQGGLIPEFHRTSRHKHLKASSQASLMAGAFLLPQFSGVGFQNYRRRGEAEIAWVLGSVELRSQ